MAHTLKTHFAVEYSPFTKVSESLLNRLISFYWNQESTQKHVSPIWHGVLKQCHSELTQALDEGNKELLAIELGNLYSGTRLWGLDLSQEDCGEPFENAFRGMWNEACINSAVALGVIPRFCRQQDNSKEFCTDFVLSSIETALKMKLTHPGGGRMAGARVSDRFVPFKLIETVETLAITHRINPSPLKMVEIGAGTGFAVWLHLQASPHAMFQYHTIDLPVISVIQAFLLAMAMGEDQIWLSKENRNLGASVFIHGLVGPYGETFDLILNQNSFPEMPDADYVRNLRWIENSLAWCGSFVSINHESDNGDQKRVFEMARKNTNLRLIHRSPFFGRDGWVVEIWRKQ